jgi:thiamine-monophosphate kinase
MKLEEIGEFGLIQRMAPLCMTRAEGVYRGIGDDCAVIDVGNDKFLLITTDLLIERTHFRVEWTSPEDLGAKSLAVNLSDIAACGGIPRDAFISLAIPKNIEVEWLDRFYRGMSQLARAHGVNLLGGDTTSSKSDLMINVALTGIVPKNEVLLRDGASPGDKLCLIGVLGESAAGLKLLIMNSTVSNSHRTDLIKAHVRPLPLVEEGRILARSGYCRALIDVSDGLSSDLTHLCKLSGVGVILFEEKITVSERIQAVFAGDDVDPMQLVLNGGEDYALLAAVSPEGIDNIESSLSRIGTPFQVIGEFTDMPDRFIIKPNGVSEQIIPQGWDHFIP